MAILLLACLTSLLMIRVQSGTDTLNAARIIATTMVALASGLAALPLLDRARAGGLVIASIATGVMLTPLYFHGLLPRFPALAGSALLYGILIAASLIGLVGSMQLPLSPQRFTADGLHRSDGVVSPLLPMGWLLFAASMLIIGVLSSPPDQVLSVFLLVLTLLGAALVPFAFCRAHDGLRKSAEAVAAAAIMFSGAAYGVDGACICIVLASASVLRNEAVSKALRIDDPQNLIGTVLVPALAGLLLPSVIAEADISATLRWGGVSIALGIGTALLLWPLTKLLFGIAKK